jgi:hypothetical protein
VHKPKGLTSHIHLFFLFTQEAFGVVQACIGVKNKREQIVVQCEDKVDIYVVSCQEGACGVQSLVVKMNDDLGMIEAAS